MRDKRVVIARKGQQPLYYMISNYKFIQDLKLIWERIVEQSSEGIIRFSSLKNALDI
jgi:hypothetical protein